MAQYELIIRNETNGDSGADSPIAGSKSASKKTNNKKADAEGKQAIGKLVAIGSTVASFVDQVVSHQVQTVSLRTGAQEQQERLSFVYSIAKQAGGTLLSTAYGAAMGGGVGAVIGLTIGLAHTAISYVQKADELRTQRALENVGLQYMNARAGGSVASFSGSRLKNQ